MHLHGHSRPFPSSHTSFSFAFTPLDRHVTLFIAGGPHDHLDVTPNITPDAHRIRGARSLPALQYRVRAGAKKGFPRHLPA
jgi:hypothetical protein